MFGVYKEVGGACFGSTDGAPAGHSGLQSPNRGPSGSRTNLGWGIAPCTFSCGNQQSIFGELASVDPDSLTSMTAIHAVRGPLDYDAPEFLYY